jgi:hypothetical protein
VGIKGVKDGGEGKRRKGEGGGSSWTTEGGRMSEKEEGKRGTKILAVTYYN